MIFHFSIILMGFSKTIPTRKLTLKLSLASREGINPFIQS